MRVKSTGPIARSKMPTFAGRIVRPLTITLVILCAAPLSFACKGGIKGKSPENPTAVLAVIGGMAIGWKSLIARIRK